MVLGARCLVEPDMSKHAFLIRIKGDPQVYADIIDGFTPDERQLWEPLMDGDKQTVWRRRVPDAPEWTPGSRWRLDFPLWTFDIEMTSPRSSAG